MSTPSPRAEVTPPVSRVDELRTFVAARVEELQRAYVDTRHPRNSWATGALAHLRRAVGSEPGSDPATWALVFEGMPSSLLGREDRHRSGALVPSTGERAVHAALTLYAVHQQARREGMHRAGAPLGGAVRRLALTSGAEDAVLRRFHALGTAQGLAEVLHHARGLLTQLRSAAIQVDHGRLAVDLDRLQRPGQADAVRLQWGRDYYAYRPAGQDEGSTTAEGSPPSAGTDTTGETR